MLKIESMKEMNDSFNMKDCASKEEDDNTKTKKMNEMSKIRMVMKCKTIV
jgi:hypothetical protein